MRELSKFSTKNGMADPIAAFKHAFDNQGDAYTGFAQGLGTIVQAHVSSAQQALGHHLEHNQKGLGKLSSAFMSPVLYPQWLEYLSDAGQRAVLFTDAMRQCGNYFVEHENNANKTVLSWDHEVVVDGSKLDRPVNYSLVRIIASEDIRVREDGRPYIIIDPRAGHGSGIGGFKHESEVGAAIHEGHPVYFVTFTRLPQPNQTVVDVTAAEAEFVREVRRRHPDSPKPIIIGNCQGGWAAMLLAATNPDITGPIVANGAPLSYWAGQKGKNPMRYLGGLVGGGAMSIKLMSDLGNGLFDGANLVANFERLSPSTTWWSKYYDLWREVDTEVPRFVGFERWWTSLYYMTEQEISWIVENLFVGNRLARGRCNLDERTHVDLRNINSPIIIFASHGDNITPPQQALGWIADNYKDVEEIRARGQRILYTLHENVGHLGIFVSSSIANKEHQEIVSTLKAIEALSPGLYEMVIEDAIGEGVDKRFHVAFRERGIPDVTAQCGGDDSDLPFAAVARYSEDCTEAYELTVRPMVRAMSNQASAELMAATNPLRLQRLFQSDRNPLMQPVAGLAEQVRAARQPAPADNPFRQLEQFNAGLVAQWLDGLRDLQSAMIETGFHLLWTAPPVAALGQPTARRVSEAPQEDLRSLVSVQDALDRIDQGGFAEGLVRMLIILAQSRKEVRRSRLERANQMLVSTEPFASMKPKHRTRLIHRESLIVGFEPEEAMAALPRLLRHDEDRRRALDLCLEIAGPREEMTSESIAMMTRLALVLESEPLALTESEYDPRCDTTDVTVQTA
ncbi:MAG: alpha/beta hydrolase [Thiohalocapsa sp. PB-PSB1]|jgi:pimeloyl-ACP methyl ester carboxylesterase/tellurite resistance protein|nr:MAG: alpha/beta hydrolase [Thiohalocapsa sp. PB-PSB1]